MLIIFEGVDGVGKSTQVELCYQWLQDKGVDVIKTKEPYNDWVKKIIPDDNSSKLSRSAKALIYMGDRYEHVLNVLLKNKHRIILLDRSQYSTCAYQLDYENEDEFIKTGDFSRESLDILSDNFMDLYERLNARVIYFKRRTDELKDIDENYLRHIKHKLDLLLIKSSRFDKTMNINKTIQLLEQNGIVNKFYLIEPDTIENTYQLIKKKVSEWLELEL